MNRWPWSATLYQALSTSGTGSPHPPVLEGSKEKRKPLQVQKSPGINEQAGNGRKLKQLCCTELSNLFIVLKGEKSRLLEILQWQTCGGKGQSLRFLHVPNPGRRLKSFSFLVSMSPLNSACTTDPCALGPDPHTCPVQLLKKRLHLQGCNTHTHLYQQPMVPRTRPQISKPELQAMLTS